MLQIYQPFRSKTLTKIKALPKIGNGFGPGMLAVIFAARIAHNIVLVT